MVRFGLPAVFLLAALLSLYVGLSKTLLSPPIDRIGDTPLFSNADEKETLTSARLALSSRSGVWLGGAAEAYALARAAYGIRSEPGYPATVERHALRALRERPLWTAPWVLLAYNEMVALGADATRHFDFVRHNYPYGYLSSPDLVLMGLFSWKHLDEAQKLSVAKLKLFCRRSGIEYDYDTFERRLGIHDEVAKYRGRAKRLLQQESHEQF